MFVHHVLEINPVVGDRVESQDNNPTFSSSFGRSWFTCLMMLKVCESVGINLLRYIPLSMVSL